MQSLRKEDANEELSLVDCKPVETAVNYIPRRSVKNNLTWHLCFAIVAAALGSGFQHGYNTGVLNAPQGIITEWIGKCEKGNGSNVSNINSSINHLDIASSCLPEATVTLLWAVIVAIYCIGGMVGGIMVGYISDGLGRKKGLLLNNVFVLIGSLLFLYSKQIDHIAGFIMARFIVGINSGINAGICPMYLSEISPKKIRGAVGTSYQLIITLSILISQILGMSTILGTEADWPYLLAISIIPGLIQVVTLSLCPESPKHLLCNKNDEDKATSSIKWLREVDSVEEEMNEMLAERDNDKKNGQISLKTMFFDASYRKPMVIAGAMMLAQQLTGINAAIFYSTSIFTEAGLDEHKAQIATLSMGAMNVAMTVVSMVVVEKAGRKTLMLVGLSGMMATTAGILICLLLKTYATFFPYLAVVLVVAFVVSFAIGPGSIPWFFVSELFTSSGRPIATSIAVITNWFANFLVGLGFSPIMLAIGPFVFVIFLIIQVFFIAYVWLQVPETKDKSPEEIAKLFRKVE